MSAVLVIVRAGVVGFLVPMLLALAVVVPLVLLGVFPRGDAGGALFDVIMLGMAALVLTHGVRWVPATPLRMLLHPVGPGDVAAAFRVGLVAMGVEWIVLPLAQGQALSLSVGPSVVEVVGIVAGAAMEEALFRGYLLEAFWRVGRPWQAVAVPSAVFAVAHLPSQAVCGGLFDAGTLLALADWGVAGLLYATMTVLSGRIWPAIVLHSLHNILVTAAGGGTCG